MDPSGILVFMSPERPLTNAREAKETPLPRFGPGMSVLKEGFTREIWTIGHWTGSESTFSGLLAAQRVDLLADVRAHPGSRSSPQFGRDSMPEWLKRATIEYVHLDELGGRRRKQDTDADINSGWENASFKNYADYTLTPAHERGIDKLAELAIDHRVVVVW